MSGRLAPLGSRNVRRFGRRYGEPHPQEAVNPISLQDLCLLRVINDVDSYPEELLASLPFWLRLRLLTNLPVLNLSHLGNTQVARGVDVDQIWRTRMELRYENKPTRQMRSTFGVFENESKLVKPAFIQGLFQMSVYRSNRDNKDPQVARLEMETKSSMQSCCNAAMSNEEEFLKNSTANALSGNIDGLLSLNTLRENPIRDGAYNLTSIRGSVLSKQLGITGYNVWQNQPTSMAAVSLPSSTNPYGGVIIYSNIFMTPHRLLKICQKANSVELLALLINTRKVRPTSVCLDLDLMSRSVLQNLQAEQMAIDNNLVASPQKVSCRSIMKCLLKNVVVLRLESEQHSHITGPMITLIYRGGSRQRKAKKLILLYTKRIQRDY